MEDYLENFGRTGTFLSLQGNVALKYNLESELRHGMIVSNLAFAVARELGLPDKNCSDIALAGMLHDIGKLRLKGYISGQKKDSLMVEELRYVRMHSMLGYEELKPRGFSDYVLKAVLHHHENYDGTGYPDNLSGKEIPEGARVIRVCDVYTALRSDRPYRKAFDRETSMEMMIEEVKDFDMEIFLAFLRVMHNPLYRISGRTPAFDTLLLRTKGGAHEA